MANVTSLPLTDAPFGTNLTDDLTNSTVAPIVNRGPPSLPWNNPNNIMTKETSDDITFAFQCFIFPILTVFGITGNIMSMIVMLQKNLRSSTTTIVLVGLAVSDIMFLATNMMRKSTCIIREYDPSLADAFNAKSFRYAFYLKTSFSRVSTLLVVVISLERLMAVAFPLKIKSVVTKSRMLLAVLSCYILVFACLAGLPPQYTHATVGGRVYISQTEFSLNNVDSLKIYNEYFLPIAFRYIPVLLVLFLNCGIIVLLQRSMRFQKKVTSKDSKREDDQRKITQMLLTVSIIYLICLLPGDVLLIASDAIDGFGFFGKYHNAFLALSDISLVFEVINSSVNFIIYMVLNRRFSEVYMQLFCPCVKRFNLRHRRTSTKGLSKGTGTTKETFDAVCVTVDKDEQNISSSGYNGSDNIVSARAETCSVVTMNKDEQKISSSGYDGSDNIVSARAEAGSVVTVDKDEQKISSSGYDGSDNIVSVRAETCSVVTVDKDEPKISSSGYDGTDNIVIARAETGSVVTVDKDEQKISSSGYDGSDNIVSARAETCSVVTVNKDEQKISSSGYDGSDNMVSARAETGSVVTVDKDEQKISSSGYDGSDNTVSTSVETGSVVQDGVDNPAYIE